MDKMAEKTAAWQNQGVSPLNCFGNDVKLNLVKTLRFAGHLPVDYYSANSYLNIRTFWLDSDRERSHYQSARSAFGKEGDPRTLYWLDLLKFHCAKPGFKNIKGGG